MINISEMISDSDFRQPENYLVTRRIGDWDNGRFNTTGTLIETVGIILPTTTDDLRQVPDGDMLTGAISIYATIKIYTTKLNIMSGESNLSDEITWKDEPWKVIQVRDFSDFGYYKAIAVRKEGA